MIINILLSLSMYTCNVQDSLPPLHTLIEDSIAGVNPSNEDDVLNVAMKNGIVYRYAHEDWDLEDENPSTSGRLREAIHQLTKAFTKVEHAPEFPGGDESWQLYIMEFCQRHKKEIRKAGKGVVYVQFIVHMKGQLRQIELIGDGPSTELIKLAKQAVRESDPWVPATQNGHTVICYQKARVDLRQ